MSFTCPRCQRASHHPQDERQGYCGACRDFTGSGDVFECGQCGTRSVVPPLHAGAVWCPCGSPEPMHAFREFRGPDLSRGLWQLAESGPEPAGGASAAAMFRYLAQRYLDGPVHFTREPTGDWQCPQCGAGFLVPPGFAGPVLCAACDRPGHPVYMAQLERVIVGTLPDEALAAARQYLALPFAAAEGGMAAAWSCEPPGLTLAAGDAVSLTVPGSVLITGPGGQESPDCQQEAGDFPWANPMQWSPGDAEL